MRALLEGECSEMPNFLDIFAGAGGLSEGFIQAGYTPVAHVEKDRAACSTLRTRSAYHWLEQNPQGGSPLELYDRYLDRSITRRKFYDSVPSEVIQSVICCELREDNLDGVFKEIDRLAGKRKVDLIVGGPPCQAYSLAGRGRSENGMVGDARNYLYKLYAKFLEEYEPACFVFENVTGLLTAVDSDGRRHLDKMLEMFEDCKYHVFHQVLNAADCGVLQNRKRLILVGARDGRLDHFPDIPAVSTEYSDPETGERKKTLVGEIFADLPELQAGEGTPKPTETKPYQGQYLYDAGIKSHAHDVREVTLHFARPLTDRDKEIYRLVAEGWKEGRRVLYTDLPEELRTHRNLTSFLDRFKVVADNLPASQTVVAHIAKDGHYFIHPDIGQNRSITPREAARLQTFPDDYYFEGVNDRPSQTAAFQQIGNAVPVRLARCIAEAMLPLFSSGGTDTGR